MGHSVIWSVVQLVTWSHSIGPLIFQSFSHSTNNHCTSVSVPKALLGVGHAAVIKKNSQDLLSWGRQMLNKQLQQKVMNGDHCDRKNMGPEGKEDQFGWILQFSIT